jgi:predicted enzyme related to lactoylglutathione lyase
MPNAIVHFEIPVDDVERAQQFYRKAFGWKISDPMKMDYFFVETRKAGEEGINGGLMKRKMPGQPFMNYIGVKSIEASLAKVVQAGGTICLPKQEIGQGMGWIACFQDTENNMMGFYQPGPGAKPAAKPAAKKSVKKKAAKKKAAKK